MGRLIHIVDDVRDVRAATSFMLRQHGYDTETYASGAEFLAQSRGRRGCLLLDVRMPKMDGLELLAELTVRGVDLPVIMLTGHGDIPLAVRAMKKGAVDFLEQPCEPDDLIRAIERAFDIGANGREAHQAEAEAAVKLHMLTRREGEVLQGLCAGMPNKSIARWLRLSPRTVEAYRANMMSKLDVTNMSHALQIAADGNLPKAELDPGQR